MWLYPIISVCAISLISLIGVFTLSINKDRLHKIVFLLVALAVGALLGDVLVHILPELYEHSGEFGAGIPIALFAGFMLFFALEKFLRWHHAHGLEEESEHVHSGDLRHIGHMNIISDGVHNFIDGILIGVSYLAGVEVGIATTIAVLLHEIPQEIGDFGLLLHVGYSRAKALFYNFLSSLAAIVGVVIALIFGSGAEMFVNMVLPITAGGLLYIAASDLVPELHRTREPVKSVVQFFGVLLGFLAMLALLLVE